MRRSTQWMMVLLALALMPLPRLAQATCWVVGGSKARVEFTMPSQITLPDTVTPDMVLWSSAMTHQNTDVDVYCDRRTDGGITNYLGMQPAPGATTFATNIPGLGIRLARGSTNNYLMATPNDYLPYGTTTFSQNTSLELVATGTIANGSTLYAGQLAHWDFGNLNSVVVFQTRNATTFTRPCTILVDPTVVTLRTVTVSELQGGGGTTAGSTPFAIKLNCAANLPLEITLDTTNPSSVINGVLNTISQSGGATGVGVQITRNGQPVRLREAIDVTTTSGPFDIQFSARYYRTNGALKPGLVAATATYTLTYP